MTHWLFNPKRLQAAWYDCLRAEGFNDVETVVNGDLLLRSDRPDRCKRTRIGKGEYFSALAAHAHDVRYANEVEQLVMLARARGTSIKAIGELLAANGVSRCRHAIRFMIRRYEMQWGIRQYNQRQLNRKGS